MRSALTLPVLGLALAVAGCGEKAAAPERKAASGEILGGEISDAMLPLDTVKSTSPADPRGPASAAPADRAGKSAAPAGSASAAASAEPAAEPAEPAPEAT